MKERPKIKLHLTIGDRILEVLGWMAVISFWTWIIYHYPALPDIIPTHFNGAGRIDGYSDKSNILLLPLISTILFGGLTLLNQFPHKFNYLQNITEENASAQYTTATRLIRYYKLIQVIVFGVIAFKTSQITRGEADGLGSIFLPIILALFFIPIAMIAFRAK